jgi:hypothetical protein
VRLLYLEKAVERDLSAAIKAVRDARFKRALAQTMKVDAEMIRRGMITP